MANCQWYDISKFVKVVTAACIIASFGGKTFAQDDSKQLTVYSLNLSFGDKSDVEESNAEESDVEESKARSESFAETHKQSRTFRPEIGGEPANLSTFRVRADGQIVAAVYGDKSTPGPDDEESTDDDAGGFVHVYSPEFELVEQFAVPFEPAALDLDASGNIFVAGSGRIAKLSPQGEIVLIVDSPTLAGIDMEELKKEMIEEIKHEQEESLKSFTKQVETFQKEIDELELVEEADRTRSQERRLKILKTQAKTFESSLEQMREQTEVSDEIIEWRIRQTSSVTAVAVNAEDVFVATGSRTGSGYDVYRMDHQLQNAQQVLTSLRGCCGQMDIHTRDGQLVVAENTRFNVAIYDRDGEELSRFGERLSKDNQGFGSCCNPMNVLCCPNGELLTAESSIGKIKRFNAEGELIGYIGRARIGGGCKHVALGHDEQRNRFYVQYEDVHQICVLEPVASVPEVVDARMSEFINRLTAGKWEFSGTASNTKTEKKMDAGIGLSVSKSDSGDVVIDGIFADGPSDTTGRITEGDTIVAISDESGAYKAVDDLSIEEVNELLGGEAGTGVRIKFRTKDGNKVRRITARRVPMEFVDGKWVFGEVPDFSFNYDELTKMKWLRFHGDRSLQAELMKEQPFGSIGDGGKWTATKIEADTLSIDVESSDDMITHRVQVRFIDDETADISVTYDGLGEKGEFRNFKLIRDADVDDDARPEVGETDSETP